MFDLTLPVSTKIIVAQTVELGADDHLKPGFQFGPLRWIDLNLEHRILHPLAEILTGAGYVAKTAFAIVARVADRLHLALWCRKCGGLNKVKRFTLMTAQPLYSHCMVQEWTADAQAAGLEFLRRDATNRHYSIFRADCGHEVTRQFGFMKRAASGGVKIRCKTCQTVVEMDEASTRDWTLIGPDPDGHPSYRQYRHDTCGHEQRMARANLQSGRHACGRCGIDWPAAPSTIYAMLFTLASGRELVKVG